MFLILVKMRSCRSKDVSRTNILLLMGIWMGSIATVQSQSVDFLEDAGRQLDLERGISEPAPVRPITPPAPPVPAPAKAVEPEVIPENEETTVKASPHTLILDGAVDIRFWLDEDLAWSLTPIGDKYFVGRSDVPTYVTVGYDYKNALGIVSSIGWGSGRTINEGIPTDFITFIDDYAIDAHAGMAYYSKFFGTHIRSLYAYIDPLGLAGVNSPVGLRLTGGILPHEGGMDSSHFMAGNYGGLDFGFNTDDSIQSGALPGMLGFRADVPVYFSTESTPLVFSVLGGLGGFSAYDDSLLPTPIDLNAKASKPWSVMAEISSKGAKVNNVFAIDWNAYYWHYHAPSQVQDWNDKSTYLPIDRLNRDSHSLGFSLGTKAQDNSPFFIGMGLAADYLVLGSGLGWRTVITDAGGQVVYQPVWTSDLVADGDRSVPKYEHRTNVAVGFSVGLDDIFSLHFAFNHQTNDNAHAFNRHNFLQVDGDTYEESLLASKQWLAVRLNVDIIKNIQIYMGMAYQLSRVIIEDVEYRPMSIDTGIEYRPLPQVTLHAGWQMGSTELGSIWAVEPSLKGAFYLRGRLTF
jgi:hypothetical protein